MARTDAYRNVDRFCVMCTKVIPEDRKSDAITCSTICTKRRSDFLRSKIDQKVCRYCNKPSTPEDRALFGMWKKAMKKGMAEEEFNAQVIETTRLAREVERLRRRLAELEVSA